MSKRHLSYLFIFFMALLIQACDSNGCFEKGGNERIEEIHLNSFTELSAHGMFELILVPDTTDYIEFKARESVIPHLTARLEDKTVLLENSNSCFYQRDYKKVQAYVHYESLGKINLYEPCKLTTMYPITGVMSLVVQAEMAEVDIEINSDQFYFYNHTTTGGKYTFRGFVDYSSITGYYTAQFNLDELEARHLIVNNSSIGDMYVNASEILEVQIHHRGNIYYTGNPQIIIDSISGSGELIHLP